jgi:2-polyprenyl-3-methyl-5-hydroxy-6-metoxy-1,4-benzoquinol methylase
MPDYLQTIYFRDEYDEKAYPQLLCNHISKNYYKRTGSIVGKRLLDIGSGKGNHLVGFHRLGYEVYGLDKREECINILRDFDIRECNIEKDSFPFEDHFFDYIFSKSVLEHVVNTDNLLSEALRILKAGGVAVFMTPDWKSQYKFFWDDYTHVKAFTRKGLQDALVLNGFEKVTCIQFLQLPIVWRYPWIKILTRIFTLLPDSFKWKDKNEKEFRRLIRFSKEEMLLAVGYKTK